MFIRQHLSVLSVDLSCPHLSCWITGFWGKPGQLCQAVCVLDMKDRVVWFPPPPLGAVQLEILFLDSDPRGARLLVMSVLSGIYLRNISTFVETTLKCDNYVISLFTNRCVVSCIPRNVHHTLRCSVEVGPLLLSRQHCILGDPKVLIFYTGNV